MALGRSSISGQGSQLESINISYSIEDNAINSLTLSLSQLAFTPASTSTPIPATPIGFTLTPGNYNGSFSIDVPSYANGNNPEYYMLLVSCVVDTSVLTELRINDIELVYVENTGSMFPDNVNIPGYLNIGSSGPPSNTVAGDTTTKRLFAGIGTASDAYRNESVSIASNCSSIGGSGNRGLYAEIIATPNGAISGSGYRAIEARASVASSASGTISSLIGINTAPRLDAAIPINTQVLGINAVQSYTNNFVGVTVANSIGIASRSHSISGGATGTITNTIGMQILSPVGLGGGVTNCIGLDINTMNIAATNNYGIRLAPAVNGVTRNYGIWFASNDANTGSGIVFGASGDAVIYRGATAQLYTPGDWMTRHYLCNSTPTISVGASSGTAPSVSITGTDHGFTVTLTTGTTATANGILFTVTWGAPWTSLAPSVTWSAGNSTTNELAVGTIPYISTVTATAMAFKAGTVALADATTYVFRFTAMR